MVAPKQQDQFNIVIRFSVRSKASKTSKSLHLIAMQHIGKENFYLLLYLSTFVHKLLRIAVQFLKIARQVG